MKNIITVTGIRPDFIRMSEIFKKLDENFNHTLIHSGQHYNKLLSDVFFDELNIRKPDYNLNIGGDGKEHFHQTSDLSIKLIELIRENYLKPDLIIFLGDSNSVVSSVSLKKEGYKIGHIEAGMRSGDKRMLEEINRMVCDICSDYLFVYHENYKIKLEKENIKENVYVVGNTIVEVVKKFKPSEPKLNNKILLDIHRPENFMYKDRLNNIIKYANFVSEKYDLPVHMLNFNRTLKKIDEFNIDLGLINVIDLLPFKSYLSHVHHSTFIISDSGTAQEEPAILNTPVIVPRDFTERPESIENYCSFMLDVNTSLNNTWGESLEFIDIKFLNKNIEWLGNGKTSENIISILKNSL
jgi:UDP-N-acetylglucosamine 2-epimerase (non-hydrolysing)